MKSPFFFLVILLCSISGKAQTNLKHLPKGLSCFSPFSIKEKASFKKVEEYNFFYSDSANGEFAYGDYEPKAIVKLHDDSIIIGTGISITFPSENKVPVTYDSTYFAKSKIFSKKGHSSSGSVFKLNTQFKKEWEIIFRNKRVEKILKTTDNHILVIGDHVTMKHIWVAKMDYNGKIIWEESYHYKNDVCVADATIDNKNNLFVLVEASHKIPLKICSYGNKKKFQFFKTSEIDSYLTVIEITPDKKVKWLKSIDRRKKYDKTGYNILSNQNSLFIQYSYQSRKKKNLIDGNRIEGNKTLQMSKKGKIISIMESPKLKLLACNTNLLASTYYAKENLFLYNQGRKIDSLTIHIPEINNYIRIREAIPLKNGYKIIGSVSNNNLDYLIINTNSSLKIKNYCVYTREEYNDTKGGVVLSDGSIVILGKCYKIRKNEFNELVTYINITRCAFRKSCANC